MLGFHIILHHQIRRTSNHTSSYQGTSRYTSSRSTTVSRARAIRAATIESQVCLCIKVVAVGVRLRTAVIKTGNALSADLVALAILRGGTGCTASRRLGDAAAVTGLLAVGTAASFATAAAAAATAAAAAARAGAVGVTAAAAAAFGCANFDVGVVFASMTDFDGVCI